VRALAFIHALFVAASAHAQLPSWVVEDPFSSADDDPIGIDRQDRLEAVEPTRTDEEAHSPIPVVHGEVLSAIAGVREEGHRVDVTLTHGLAVVEVSMSFVSSARYAAEVRYRLAVPQGAAIAALEVCNAHGCRAGIADASEGLGPYDDAVRSRAPGADSLPVAHAAIDHGFIRVRAAPVQREGRPRGGRASLGRTPAGDGPLTVRVRYVVPAPVRGGRVRLALPARGRDLRVAPSSISVRSDELSRGSVAGLDAVERRVERSSTQVAEITAVAAGAPRVAYDAVQTACGAQRCVRLRAVAAPAPGRARDVILLLDASPSTEGAARARMRPVIAALLAAMPSGSRVRAVVFAARAEAVIAEPQLATEVSLAELTSALDRELGSATRFEAAWEIAARWPHDLVVIVGDGGLTSGDAARTAIARVRQEIVSINVADRASTEALRSAIGARAVIDVGAEAARAASDHGVDALEERLAPLFAPVVEPRVLARAGRTIDLGPLRAGEEIVWEGQARGRVSIGTASAGSEPGIELALRDRIEQRSTRLAAVAPASIGVAASCGEPAPSQSAPVSRDERLALADPRRCEQATRTEEVVSAPSTRIARLAQHQGESGLPAQSLLELLRQRIVPIARGCFRDDRAGRAAYSTRATFEFRLADREVVAADVRGRLEPELRACLLRAVDGLEIPRFDGAIDVRYPIHTAAEPVPPTLTLDSDIAGAVDAIAEEP
jgi:hypothetical protein